MSMKKENLLRYSFDTVFLVDVLPNSEYFNQANAAWENLKMVNRSFFSPVQTLYDPIQSLACSTSV